MTLVERIQDLFTKFNTNLEVSEKVELKTEAVLDNGTVICTDGDSFVEGAYVYIINEEGEQIPLPEGDYTMEDGRTIGIGEGSTVTVAPAASEAEGNLPKSGKAPAAARRGDSGVKDQKKKDGGVKPVVPPKAKKSKQDKLMEQENVQLEEEVKDEVVAQEETREEMTEEKVVELINKIIDERMGDKEKKMEEEEEEMGVGYDPDKNYSAQIDELKAELSALKNEAAATGVKRAVPKPAVHEPVDMTNLSTEERITALFNKFNQ